MVFLALLSALAFVAAMVIRIPVVPSAPFLKFDIKEAVIVTGGFLYGPGAGLAVSFTAVLIQAMLTNESGMIGFIMNFLSTASFVCTASAFYRAGGSRKNMLAGLTAGTVIMTIVMLLWNYIVTPVFMGIPRSAIVSMLFTVFLPFNLVKGAANSAIVYLYIDRLVNAASDLKFYSMKEAEGDKHSWMRFVITAGFLISGVIAVVMILQGLF